MVGGLIEPVAVGVGVVPVRTPTLAPATHTNVWVLGERRVTVVDPASPYDDEQERLLGALRDVEVERIVLTHHHPDHVSGAAALQRSLLARGQRVPIVAHPLTEALVGPSLVVDEQVGAGEVMWVEGRPWEVHHTPGHAPGHLVLHDVAGGSMVAGDMVAGVGTILIGPDDGHLGQYLASLQHMQALGAQRLLPAHGPVLEHAGLVLGMYIAHRHQRTEQVREAVLRLGRAELHDIVPRVYPELDPAVWPVAALQVYAHLRWLVEIGLVEAQGDGWAVI